MRKVKKPVFFIVFAVIALFTLSTIFGVHSQYGDIVKTYVHGVGDIRLGIDIQGGVDVTFEPAGDVDATEEQMDAALETIKLRLANQNISDSETYLDYKSNRIIVRYPWQAEVSARDFHSVFPPVVSKNISYNEKGAPRLLRGAPIGYHSLSCLTSDEIDMVFHNKSLWQIKPFLRAAF